MVLKVLAVLIRYVNNVTPFLWCAARWPLALLSRGRKRWKRGTWNSQSLSDTRIIVVCLLSSCFRAGLAPVEFKDTHGNKLDKSQRFSKTDGTKRKSVWKKICRKCLGCSSGTRRKLLGGGRLLEGFTDLGMRLLSPWIGGLGSGRHGQARLCCSASTDTACSPPSPAALPLGRGSRGGSTQINPWVIVWVHSQWLYSLRTAFILSLVSREINSNTSVC